MQDRRSQLPLNLREHRGWGGRRRGAGRKHGPNPGVPHRRRECIAARHPIHVTVRLRPGLPTLRTVPFVRDLERSFAAVRARTDFRLVHYALQNTHAHFVVEATDTDALARGMMAVGARIARALNRVSGRRGSVLAERFHLRVLRTPRDVRNVLAYVLLNARRRARRIARALRIDPASSGRWFDGWRWQPVVSDHGPEIAPVSEPMTWLLRIGWRRHGLIDPDEIPAASGRV